MCKKKNRKKERDELKHFNRHQVFMAFIGNSNIFSVPFLLGYDIAVFTIVNLYFPTIYWGILNFTKLIWCNVCINKTTPHIRTMKINPKRHSKDYLMLVNGISVTSVYRYTFVIVGVCLSFSLRVCCELGYFIKTFIWFVSCTLFFTFIYTHSFAIK